MKLLDVNGGLNGSLKGPRVVARAKVDDRHFEAVSKYKWHLGGHAHPRTTLPDGSSFYLHWLVYELEHGRRPPPPVEIDHVDRDPLNAQADNLRAASFTIQNANRPIQKNNTSGHRCVYWEKLDARYRAEGCWRVRIERDRKQVFSKRFPGTQEGYDEAVKVARVEFLKAYPELVA